MKQVLEQDILKIIKELLNNEVCKKMFFAKIKRQGVFAYNICNRINYQELDCYCSSKNVKRVMINVLFHKIKFGLYETSKIIENPFKSFKMSIYINKIVLD